MRGIIWADSKTNPEGPEQFLKIYENYQQLHIKLAQLIQRSQEKMMMIFENNDIWELRYASKNAARGLRCNIAYIHRNIPEEILYEDILPTVIGKPYCGINYYGSVK